jgi:hypothetical protein
MRTTSLVAVALVTVSTCIGAALLATRSPAAPAPALPMGVKAWEYKVLAGTELITAGGNKKSSDGLNALGAEGWELVTVTENPNGGHRTFYLKRPK